MFVKNELIFNFDEDISSKIKNTKEKEIYERDDDWLYRIKLTYKNQKNISNKVVIKKNKINLEPKIIIMNFEIKN